MFYTVGEIARKLNIAPSTLRYYDKEGLLPFVERSDGGIRMFNSDDFEWIRMIECLKQAGMHIRDIKTFIDWCMEGDSTISQRLEIIEDRQRALEAQILQMQETLNMLKYKRWYYETAKKAGTTTIHDQMDPDQIPEEIKELKNKLDQIQKI